MNMFVIHSVKSFASKENPNTSPNLSVIINIIAGKVHMDLYFLKLIHNLNINV